MPRSRNTFFGPSERAIEFGRQYGVVLERWAELFLTASKLVEANVKLGEMTAEASKEFDEWLKATSNSPWNWMNPEVMRRFMGGASAESSRE